MNNIHNLSEDDLKEKNIAEFLDGVEWLANEPNGRYLYNGLSQYYKQSAEDKKSIEQFLGVDFPGGRGNRKGFTRLQDAARNRLIVRAIQLLQKQDGTELWNAAETLHQLMVNFRITPLRRLRNGHRQVNNEIEQFLFEIYEIDNDPPISRDHLYSIALEILSKKIIPPS